MFRLTLSIVTLLFSFTTFAVETESRAALGPEKIEGLRVSLIKSAFDAEWKVNAGGSWSDGEGDVKQEYGLGIGYMLVRRGDLGILGEMIYAKFNEDISSNRFDAALTYGFSRGIYLLGGMNYHRFNNDKELSLRSGTGLRIGGGMMFEENIGFSLSYVMIDHSNTYAQTDEIRSEMKLSGFEAAINGTF